jgi:hypothetical protein
MLITGIDIKEAMYTGLITAAGNINTVISNKQFMGCWKGIHKNIPKFPSGLGPKIDKPTAHRNRIYLPHSSNT